MSYHKHSRCLMLRPNVHVLYHPNNRRFHDTETRPQRPSLRSWHSAVLSLSGDGTLSANFGKRGWWICR